MDDESQENDSTVIYSGVNLGWDANTTEISVAILDNNGNGIDFIKSSGNNDSAPSGTSWIGSGISLSDDVWYRKNNADSEKRDDWEGAAEHPSISSIRARPTAFFQTG